MTEAEATLETEYPRITELTKTQRRVLGVLVEKAFTTPEYYPLTLKAVTAGCNQKSNRNPVYNYSPDAVLDVLDELRALGLVAVVHTESGRTERYRHYMRKRFDFSEAQLAIMIELLLRGRQSMGELRSRASRMVAIESLSQLRVELRQLLDLNYIQASGSLDRRGVEIDHNLYLTSEGKQLSTETTAADSQSNQVARSESVDQSRQPPAPATESSEEAGTNWTVRLATLETTVEQLRLENKQLHEEFDAFKEDFRQLIDRLEDLRNDLGG